MKNNITHQKIIDGKKYAAIYLSKLLIKIETLKAQGILPKLAVILVGDDPASQIYVRNKINKAKELGILVEPYLLDPQSPNFKEDSLISLISKLNADLNVNGVLLQLPVPIKSKVDFINLIDPAKDVDGLHHVNIGKLNAYQDCLEPCTPKGALMLIKKALGDDLSGSIVLIIGRSQIVGRPMVSMMIRENCTVIAANSYSKDLKTETQRADIIISATGQPGMIKKDWVKPGACIIDVGIVRVDERIVGDVDFEDVLPIAGHITPVPGGVGPMTIACMLGNVIKATSIQHGLQYEEIIC